MGRNPEREVVKWLTLKELNEEIRKRKICSEVFGKLFFIKNRFGVEYSLRHVNRILKSSGMKYAKPYQRDYRRSENAEKKLKNLKTF
ncbi:MAG: winged helix-turn-helix domain-containing protein [Candidatus Syntropharchaeia archaeon]